MKKLLLIASFALLGTTAATAQSVKFGPKAGYSYSMLKAKDGDGATFNANKSTFYAGGFIEYKFNDQFGIMGEVLYSPIGGKEEQTASGSANGVSVNASAKVDYKFGTVQVPVGVKFFPSENFAIAAGMNFGIITTAEGEYSVSGSTSGTGMDTSMTQSGVQDIKDQVKTLNLAPFIGAEFALENGLFFDARYNLGVSNLVKDAANGESVKNSFVQVGIGFKFGGN